MSKLFNLKEWLTVADAAKHLSIVFGENIADADVLQLGLDERLRLSVYFMDRVKVQRKKLVQYVHYEDEGDAPPMLTDNDSMWLPILDGYASVRGLWDLPMIGTEWFDIENRYRNLINNPPVTIQGLGGASVEGLDGEICRLQMEYDESDRPLHEPLRGAMIVVRTDALREFEASINGAPTERAHLSDEPAPSRRKQQLETILAVIAALEYEPLQIPDGGKAKTKTACLTRPALFTDASFDHAWKQAVSTGLVRMENHDKFIQK